MSRSSLVIVGILASAYIIRPASAPVVEAGPPVVVRRVGAKPMSLEEALDQMRLAERDWLVFRNARSRVVNVLRRLPDGIVELVEPGA